LGEPPEKVWVNRQSGSAGQGSADQTILAAMDDEITLAELAEEFGISRERVRQIEVGAFAKVQNAVKHRVAAITTPEPLQVR
jgi:sigma-70-like protein